MKNTQPTCRFCQTPLTETFADLGMSPVANAYLKPDQLQAMEPFYPLHAYTCTQCLLVQLQEFETPQQIFSDYAYFSSYSSSWLEHAKTYTQKMTQRWSLNQKSLVVELASNDGYLLQYFKAQSIPVLGVEPAANVAKVAIQKGIPTEVHFFGAETAQTLCNQGKSADLLLANNVLAHVPDLNSFVAGMKILLKPQGIITVEFPHLLSLIQNNQFDTIYHEHFSYFSLLTVEKIFAHHGITLFDVEQLTTHGGSLRIYGRHTEDRSKPISEAIQRIKKVETTAGLDRIETYTSFEKQVRETKWNFLNFLIEAKKHQKTIVAYGAPAKGNTLLNYCGVRTDFIDYTVDLNPHKQNTFLPGTLIPVKHPDAIRQSRPDYVVILPWNLKTEISSQLSFIREWGGQFVVPIPTVQVF